MYETVISEGVLKVLVLITQSTQVVCETFCASLGVAYYVGRMLAQIRTSLCMLLCVHLCASMIRSLTSGLFLLALCKKETRPPQRSHTMCHVFLSVSQPPLPHLCKKGF